MNSAPDCNHSRHLSGAFYVSRWISTNYRQYPHLSETFTKSAALPDDWMPAPDLEKQRAVFPLGLRRP
jgi:hypothetical protein